MTSSTSSLVRPFFSAFWTYIGYTVANFIAKIRSRDIVVPPWVESALAGNPAGGVAEDRRHACEFFLQRCLGVAAGVAPGRFDLAAALAPAVAGLSVGNALAAVVLPLAGGTGAQAGVAIDADGLKRNAARLGLGAFADVAIVARGMAEEDRRRWQAVGIGDAGRRRGVRAFGCFGRGSGSGGRCVRPGCRRDWRDRPDGRLRLRHV